LQLFPWQYCEKTRKLTCDEVNDYINKLLSDVTEEEIEIKTWEIEESFG
jgi:transcriptional regulator CtsR